MDEYLNIVTGKRVELVIKNLKKNGISGYFVPDKASALDMVKKMIEPGQSVAVGGSRTLVEIGAIEMLRTGDYNFIDRNAKDITPEQIIRRTKEGLLADVFVTSTNAVTEDGELYNVDGTGNRVAALNYGPDKVIVVVGVNKLVSDLDEAILRVQQITSPALTLRLKRNTPCSVTGYCTDCDSPERICNVYSIIKKQRDKNRMHVIIVNENLGY